MPESPAERGAAPFGGDGAGDEPLTWGRHGVLTHQVRQQHLAGIAAGRG